MQLGLESLIDEELSAHAEECREFNAARGDDNPVMAARLSAAGQEVDVRVYPESPHGFASFPTAMAATAIDDIESWLGDRFLERGAERSAVRAAGGGR